MTQLRLGSKSTRIFWGLNTFRFCICFCHFSYGLFWLWRKGRKKWSFSFRFEVTLFVPLCVRFNLRLQRTLFLAILLEVKRLYKLLNMRYKKQYMRQKCDWGFIRHFNEHWIFRNFKKHCKYISSQSHVRYCFIEVYHWRIFVTRKLIRTVAISSRSS